MLPLLFRLVTLLAAESEPMPYLVFDARGHTAAVSKVRFTPDGQQLVTVSTDKSVRFWDVRTGECLDVLRPPIGPGPAGMLYAAAVSADGRWLAVGGFEHPGVDHGIFMIRLPERRLAAVLRGHANVILDLAFSPDGRWLASASADKTGRLWDVPTLRNVTTFRGHRESVYAVAFSPDSRRVATASLDHSARIWTVGAMIEPVVLRGSAPLQAMAWSADGQRLVTGGVDQMIQVWPTDSDGQGQQRFDKLGNSVTAVRFTREGKLFFTLGGGEAKDGGFLFDPTLNRMRLAFTGHENSVLDGTLSPDESLAATADANGEVCVWRTRDATLVQRLRSAGRRPWSAAWDARTATVAWGQTSHYVGPNERGPLEFAFSLHDLEFVPVPPQPQPARTALLNELDSRTVGVFRPRSEPTRLTLKNEYDRVRCFTWLDGQTAAIGADFGLFLYDAQSGRPLRSLAGHAGAVWAVAPSPDGRWLLSAGDDQTLRIWSWRDGRLVLSLFFASPEWIAWTPAGHYAASPGGERLLGWQVNNGPDQLGSFYPAGHFRKSLYQPALLRRLLDADETPREDITTVRRVLPPLVRIVEPTQSPLEISQPNVTVRATAQARGPQPVLALRLLLDGRPYEGRKGVQVVPVTPPSEVDRPGEWTVTLTPGRHQIAVQAETAVSKSVSEPLEISFQPPTTESSRLPDLYVLTIGIADYAGPLRLEYAAKDAQSLSATLQRVSASLFRRVHPRVLANADATRHEMLSSLTWLRREATQQDVSLIFFSGHGAKDDAGNFYLVPRDGDPTDLLATGVSGDQLKNALAAIPGRVLVLLDACHAGAAGGDRRKGVTVQADDLVRDLVTDDYGVVVMCSSMGREFSLESAEHQQGYFTVALLEALTGKADFNGDGLVYLTEIDSYLADRVKSLTQGRQHPVTTKPATIRSFPLSKPKGG